MTTASAPIVPMTPAPAAATHRRSYSLWSDAMRRLRKNRMAIACAIVVVGVAAASFFGPWLVHRLLGTDATTIDTALSATPPSWRHWMGTDALGRDMLVRTMVGGKFALIVAFTATTVAVIIGVSWGAIAAYAGGKADALMMRIVDVLYAFPVVVFVIVVSSIIDVQDPFWKLVLLFALIGAISWLTMARIVRGQVISLRHREFVEAARCLGVPPRRILFRHIVPNTLGPVIVYATLSMPSVMLTEAFLSFLGLGVQAPRASLGTLVSEGISQIVVYPWVLLGPGAVMATLILALNFLGDGLRDALDPQTRKG